MNDKEAIQNNEEITTEKDHQLKLAEIEIKHKEIDNKRFIESLKIIITGIVVTLIPAIISHQIKSQEVEIQRLKEEIEYLVNFSDEVAEESDLVKRKNYVEYLANIAHSKDSRKRWKQYLEVIQNSADEQKKLDIEISEKQLDLIILEYALDDLNLLLSKNRSDSNRIRSSVDDTRDTFLLHSMQMKIAEVHRLQQEIEILYHKRESLIESGRITSPVNISLYENLLTDQSSSGIPAPAIDLIKQFEGLILNAYPDPFSGGDSYSIGHSTTRYPDGTSVKAGDQITKTQAEEFLIWELNTKIRPALEDIPTWHSMNINQQSALYSFAFSVETNFYGQSNFSSITELCDSTERWNDQEWVTEIFSIYRNPGTSVEAGLLRRREAEAELFLKPET